MILKRLTLALILLSQASFNYAGNNEPNTEEKKNTKKRDSKTVLIASLTTLILFQALLYERSRRKLEGLYATQYERDRSFDRSKIMLRAYNAFNELGDVLDKIRTGDLELLDEEQVNGIIGGAKGMLKTPRPQGSRGNSRGQTPRRRSNPT
jgi:hypothetical protein